MLSHFVVEHHVLNAAFKSSIAHQQGWMTSTRFSRPMGHLGEPDAPLYRKSVGLIAPISTFIGFAIDRVINLAFEMTAFVSFRKTVEL